MIKQEQWEKEYRERFGEGKYYKPILAFIKKTRADDKERIVKMLEGMKKHHEVWLKNVNQDQLLDKIIRNVN